MGGESISRIKQVCCSTACGFISIFFLFAVPIANVVIGSMYKEDCPIQIYIPLYLIVGGSFGIFLGVSRLIQSFYKCCCQKNQEEGGGVGLVCLAVLEGVVGIFLVCWFIAGCVWVYGSLGQVQYDDAKEDTYCNYTVFTFAFWMLNTTFLLIGVSILLCICIAIVACCCA